MKAYLVEEVFPVVFSRGGKGLTENDFQSMFEIFVDGVSTGSAAATIEQAHLMAEAVHGIKETMPVAYTYFSGF